MEKNSTKNMKLYHFKDNLDTSTRADRQNASEKSNISTEIEKNSTKNMKLYHFKDKYASGSPECLNSNRLFRCDHASL